MLRLGADDNSIVLPKGSNVNIAAEGRVERQVKRAERSGAELQMYDGAAKDIAPEGRWLHYVYGSAIVGSSW